MPVGVWWPLLSWVVFRVLGAQLGCSLLLGQFGIFLLIKGKAAGNCLYLGGLHEQPDGQGSLGQALEMLGRHRDRLLSTATT
jgi:hypothetical protein